MDDGALHVFFSFSLQVWETKTLTWHCIGVGWVYSDFLIWCISCSSNPKWAKLLPGLGGAAPETLEREEDLCSWTVGEKQREFCKKTPTTKGSLCLWKITLLFEWTLNLTGCKSQMCCVNETFRYKKLIICQPTRATKHRFYLLVCSTLNNSLHRKSPH